jgi:hypothetical protein
MAMPTTHVWQHTDLSPNLLCIYQLAESKLQQNNLSNNWLCKVNSNKDSWISSKELLLYDAMNVWTIG